MAQVEEGLQVLLLERFADLYILCIWPPHHYFLLEDNDTIYEYNIFHATSVCRRKKEYSIQC